MNTQIIYPQSVYSLSLSLSLSLSNNRGIAVI